MSREDIIRLLPEKPTKRELELFSLLEYRRKALTASADALAKAEVSVLNVMRVHCDDGALCEDCLEETQRNCKNKATALTSKFIILNKPKE